MCTLSAFARRVIFWIALVLLVAGLATSVALQYKGLKTYYFDRADVQADGLEAIFALGPFTSCRQADDGSSADEHVNDLIVAQACALQAASVYFVVACATVTLVGSFFIVTAIFKRSPGSLQASTGFIALISALLFVAIYVYAAQVQRPVTLLVDCDGMGITPADQALLNAGTLPGVDPLARCVRGIAGEKSTGVRFWETAGSYGGGLATGLAMMLFAWIWMWVASPPKPKADESAPEFSPCGAREPSAPEAPVVSASAANYGAVGASSYAVNVGTASYSHQV